ncbi:conserved hypothetical protein [Pyrenophora tritici-repentis Pt-1C-BFP]|uniref:Integrase catalytic domain-containing protein n=1 Tax=Pyrenophora tritici-repentis (strain Pt-1C-BFP) TaxID=426418 RepID=B2W7S2_PYRTR|nr:uncharacterized protein PTRG_05860 [Pyrenophora tritici-repentis Pt-1C-BFP]EDU48780.1 conserved hypothetical protein [Pyrenophora tritici-repentis Pt-1C-BFP]
MWDREKKYTGKPYDLLDDKLKIFYSICYHADIQPDQFHAVFPRILEGRAQDYYLHFVDQRTDTFLTVYTKLKNHFDTDVNHSHYYADWTTTSFAKVHRENPDKTLHEVLDIMLDKLQLCQRALGQQYMGEYALRTTVITACRGVKEFAMALYRPSLECEVLFGDLRSSIENSLAMTTSVNFTEVDQDNQYYLDRRYNSNRRNRGGSRGGTRGAFQKGEQSFDSSRGFKPRWKKKCFVCQKEGCWSTNHTDEERKTARAQFFSMLYFTVKIDTSTAGKASIKFGKGEATASIGTVQVSTEIGKINFEVLEAPTPFLLCLADMDRLKVYFNNTTDELVQDKIRIPVLRKWGHPWFHLNKRERATVFLTETELRRLHRRFGHPAVTRLVKLLKDAGHNDFEERTLEEVTKFCHHCQLHSSAPRRFKFTLKDDHHFNYEILVDVMYLSGKPVLHVVDSSTAFQGAKFLSAISAKETWQALRMLWIDTYQGPPDIITHDAGTNFASAEFRAEAKIMGVTCKQVPTEAHWSVGKTERYHAPLRRAWDILHDELQDDMSDEAILQMAVKAVNDTAGPDGLVPTLLVFGAYPRMTTESPPAPSMVRRSEAIQKATKALRKLTAERQVADALNARNGPATADMLALPLQSEVLVWRESDGWNGPYKIASIDGHNVTVDMVNGPTTFRSTVVKPYYRPDHLWSDPDAPHAPNEPHEPVAVPPAVQPRKRGRPPGSKNKRKGHAYITKKEQDDLELAIKLRNDGVITTSGAPFEASDDQEISDLVGRGVFKFEQYDERLHSKIRIFKSRLQTNSEP